MWKCIKKPRPRIADEVSIVDESVRRLALRARSQRLL
ncbi:hypothetical protein RB13311 [Rhodopirellula baltica SH 1]|uniref:Uncharacterized protein n=1 Tax=Rhodopirellula baltica (strain DSM 10527 / NCIMB 13988 / SH1) TaxID=243090 RepID=Q7UHC1_RHOBA|nr:hypothetical protein RB13311 [Rhodopirellula baltica SH 1]